MMSSFQTLPPVWEKWKDEDFDKLSLPELESLYVILQNRVYDVEIRYEQEIVFYKRNREKILAREKRMKAEKGLASSR